MPILITAFNQCCGSGIRDGKKSRSVSGIYIPDYRYISDSLETIFWVKILKFFDADPGIFLTLDPGSGLEKFGSATLP
jgi:hypothetical protein